MEKKFVDARLEELKVGDLIGYSQRSSGVNSVTVGTITKLFENARGVSKVSIETLKTGSSAYGDDTRWREDVRKNSSMMTNSVFKL
jgi:hypothetical protein